MKDLNKNLKKSAKMILNNLPIILGVVLLVSLINSAIPKEAYSKLLNNDFGVIISAIIGGLSIGSPIISYIIAGELIKTGISFVVINAFLISWVTVGVLQIPIESKIFGAKFAVLRMIINLILSIIGAYLIYWLVNIL